jgi:hypothetical protein
MPDRRKGGAFMPPQIGLSMELPNYQPQPLRFGQMCRNCKFSERDGKVSRCKKYEQTVRPNWFCDDWEADGMQRHA